MLYPLAYSCKQTLKCLFPLSVQPPQFPLRQLGHQQQLGKPTLKLEQPGQSPEPQEEEPVRRKRVLALWGGKRQHRRWLRWRQVQHSQQALTAPPGRVPGLPQLPGPAWAASVAHHAPLTQYQPRGRSACRVPRLQRQDGSRPQWVLPACRWTQGGCYGLWGWHGGCELRGKLGAHVLSGLSTPRRLMKNQALKCVTA